MSRSHQIVSSLSRRVRHWPVVDSCAAAAAGRGDPTFLLGLYAYTDTQAGAVGRDLRGDARDRPDQAGNRFMAITEHGTGGSWSGSVTIPV